MVNTTAGVDNTAAGYHVCLDELVSLVETDNPPPFIDADPTEYEQAYAYLAQYSARSDPGIKKGRHSSSSSWRTSSSVVTRPREIVGRPEIGLIEIVGWGVGVRTRARRSLTVSLRVRC